MDKCFEKKGGLGDGLVREGRGRGGGGFSHGVGRVGWGGGEEMGWDISGQRS